MQQPRTPRKTQPLFDQDYINERRSRDSFLPATEVAVVNNGWREWDRNNGRYPVIPVNGSDAGSALVIHNTRYRIFLQNSPSTSRLLPLGVAVVFRGVKI